MLLNQNSREILIIAFSLCGPFPPYAIKSFQLKFSNKCFHCTQKHKKAHKAFNMLVKMWHFNDDCIADRLPETNATIKFNKYCTQYSVQRVQNTQGLKG